MVIIMNFIINGFHSTFKAKDLKGRRAHYTCRYAACFIITLKGSICFSFDGGFIISDKNNPVFLPQGLSYTNECLENAESIVFNFFISDNNAKPSNLHPISPEFANNKFESIEEAESLQDSHKTVLILSELYSLAYQLLANKNIESHTDIILKNAIEFMNANYADPNLTAYHIANHCFISEIYLRKIFAQKKGTTPHRTLTEIRMKKAYSYALEKRPVKEIALSVGYSDVYQFSRAYKKYFGYSPSRTV